MENIAKKYSIKIPNNTTVIYCEEKKNYNSNRTFKTKKLKLKVKVVIMERILKVSDVPFRKFLIMKEKN
jgi:hypothetical protein